MAAGRREPLDIVIAGGGLVGLSGALALALRGRPCTVIEAQPPGATSTAAAADTRHLALAQGSVLALQALGVWPALQGQAAALQEIHVSRRGRPGRVLLSAAEHGFERFGAVVPAPALLAALQARVEAEPLIDWRRPQRVTATALNGTARQIDLLDDESLQARLLVVAEGSDSPLRQALGLTVSVHDYHSRLLACAVRAEQPPRGRAYERLDEDGPLALLPRVDGRFGMVWTVPEERADALLAADEADFLTAFQRRFGQRLGRLSGLGRRSGWPLQMRWAESLWTERAVLIGNAAQSLHPIGAQGFNLGLRDALCLAAQVADAADPGAASALQAHAAARTEDREATRRWTTGLLALRPGGSALGPLAALSFAALDLSPALQRPLVERAMGLHGLTWLPPAAASAA